MGSKTANRGKKKPRQSRESSRPQEEAKPTAQRRRPQPKEVACGRYVATKKIGSGGFGEVFVGKPSKNARVEGMVAIKRYRPDPMPFDATPKVRQKAASRRAGRHFGISATAIREIANLRAIGSHPNLVALRDVGFAGERPFAVLDLYPNDLFEAAQKMDPASRKTVARSITQQLCRALAHLDSLGIVHRDVKMENVLCRNSTNSLDGICVVLCDLGSSRYVRESRPPEVRDDASDQERAVGQPVGRRISDEACLTVLAPEMRDRRVCDHLSDVFLMAVCVYEFVALRTFSEEEIDDPTRLARSCSVPELEQCFCRRPEVRPRAKDLLATLSANNPPPTLEPPALPKDERLDLCGGLLAAPREASFQTTDEFRSFDSRLKTLIEFAAVKFQIESLDRVVRGIATAAAFHDRNRFREPELTLAAAISIVCKYVGHSEDDRLRAVSALLEEEDPRLGSSRFSKTTIWSRLASVEWAVFAAVEFDLHSRCWSNV